MTNRSSLPETRNWLKTIPEIVVFIDLLSPAQRAALKNLLRALAKHGRAKSEDLWKKNKAPMAVYWRVKSVYARLFSYLIKDRPAKGDPIWPVCEVEMVDWSSGFEQPAPSEWRIEIDGYCADFPTETAAANFRQAILAHVHP